MADARTLTATTIAERLVASSIAPDPASVALKGLSADIVSAWFPSTMREAAVLIALIQRESGLNVLLTERTAMVTDHPGQISFPGGRAEAGDADLRATALRETHEETGLPPESIEVLGYLDPYPVISGYAVVPVVGLVREIERYPLLIAPREVESAFEVPLEFLTTEGNAKKLERARDGIIMTTYEYRYEGRRIWGATAHMIKNFIEIIN
jgi:8-oxo-dGTP pyrophosphatase MutT (NUDIX family)